MEEFIDKLIDNVVGKQIDQQVNHNKSKSSIFMAHGFHSYLKPDGKWLLTRVSNHPFGSFHKCGYPNSWMGYFMEIPVYKWMITWGTPMTQETCIYWILGIILDHNGSIFCFLDIILDLYLYHIAIKKKNEKKMGFILSQM